MHAAAGNAVTVLTARGDSPGFGRIVRDAGGAFLRIVEERDATEAERAIDEFNSGLLRVRRRAARRRHQAGDDRQQPAARSTSPTWWRSCAATGTRSAPCSPPTRRRSRASTTGSSSRRRGGRSTTGSSTDWMLAGVTITDPASTWIDVTVTIGQDAEIGPQTQLEGATVIGAGAKVGPGCLLEDTTVGEDAVLLHAVCRQAEVGPRVTIGPFAYLRPGASIADGRPHRHLRRAQEVARRRGREGTAPHLRRRRDHRRRAEHRRRDDLRQLRRGAQAPHRGRRERLRRQQHACSSPRSRSATAPTRRPGRRSARTCRPATSG